MLCESVPVAVPHTERSDHPDEPSWEARGTGRAARVGKAVDVTLPCVRLALLTHRRPELAVRRAWAVNSGGNRTQAGCRRDP
jgi:hypothetical protein